MIWWILRKGVIRGFRSYKKCYSVFFDEIRANDAQPVCRGSVCKKSDGDYARKMSALKVAVFKVREMPRFKEDSGIYFYVKRDNGWGEVILIIF